LRKGSFSAGRISLARGPEIPCRDRRSPLCRWTDVSGLHAVRGAASRTAGVRGARAPRTVCRPAHGGSLRVGGWSSPRAPQAPPKVCGRAAAVAAAEARCGARAQRAGGGRPRETRGRAFCVCTGERRGAARVRVGGSPCCGTALATCSASGACVCARGIPSRGAAGRQGQRISVPLRDPLRRSALLEQGVGARARPFCPSPPSCRARAPAAGGACHRCQQCLDRIPLGVHRDAAHGSARAPRTCPLGGRSRTLGRRVACKLETSGLPVVRVMYTGTNAALHGSDLGATSSSGITVGLRHGSDA